MLIPRPEFDFSDRLAAAVQRCRTPAVVGLDPRAPLLPQSLTAGIKGRNWDQWAAACRDFCKSVIDVVAPLVPAVKPQVAFFEELGPPGMEALGKVIKHARKSGLIVIVDAKRGDIGSTAEAYANGFLGASAPWQADALTVNPYLGDDSLMPFVEHAREFGAGLFVLVKTSNPGSQLFQDLIAEGKTVYQHVAEYVEHLASMQIGECGYGSVGAVVGATHPDQLRELRAAMPHCWILVPGYGRQGGTARSVAAAFDQHGLGAIVNNSRDIIFAWKRKPYDEQFGEARWQEAVEAATHEMIADLATAIPTSDL